MIEVRYMGRLGNNLFQYCFGRILAERMGFKLEANPIPGFPNTRTKIEGHDYSSRPTQFLTGQIVDLEAVVKDKTKRKIVLSGYFQRYEYYKKHKDVIREDWLSMDISIDEKVNPEDIVAYLRRGEVVRDGYAMPFSYFKKVLKMVKYERLFLCTDDPQDPFISLFRKYKPIVYHTPNDYLKDFKFITLFDRIIASSSTFNWWAAFLSNAKEIFVPACSYGYIWGKTKSDISGMVDD